MNPATRALAFAIFCPDHKPDWWRKPPPAFTDEQMDEWDGMIADLMRQNTDDNIDKEQTKCP
jgi:hypothetical protein